MKRWLLFLATLGLLADGMAGVIPVRVTGSRVNLRARPGLNYEVVGQAGRDDVLLARTFQTEWVEILPPAGTKAYVYASMIRDNMVAVEELNVRSGPGVNYSAIGRLKQNMLVVVKGTFGDEWLEIDAPADCSLWISANYVEPTRPLARATPAPSPPPAPDPAPPSDDPVPITATPVPDAPAAVGLDPELEDSRGHLLPGSVTLVPLAGQGRRGECAGVLRKTPLLERRAFRFRLVESRGDLVHTLGYLYGNEPQLNRLVGREMIVRGPEFWVREYDESVLIPEEIVLKEPGE